MSAAPGMRVGFIARKDLDLALALAETVDTVMPQGRLNRSVIDEAIAAGFGDHDMSAVAEHLRQTPKAETELGEKHPASTRSTVT
jgi:3-hydroxyisobutyrate dehydrogenase-like beta-hydroxyacid dehydrogenase